MHRVACITFVALTVSTAERTSRRFAYGQLMCIMCAHLYAPHEGVINEHTDTHFLVLLFTLLCHYIQV